MRFETDAIHFAQGPDPLTGSVIVPVYQTSTFEQDAIGRLRNGYEYTRTGNPTRKALEDVIARLEGADYGLAFASGMAAIDAVLTLLRAGDHVILADDIYGGTYRIVDKIFAQWGVEVSHADHDDLKSFASHMRKNTRLVLVETPTNPLLKIIDLKGLAAIAHTHRALLAVDNTFATPYFQKPLALGVDIVIHSTTKYISGHSDIIGGAVVTNDQEVYEKLKFFQNAKGAVPGIWDCWLTLRGLKTLSLRMNAHAENARYLAEFLAGHPRVERVYYPGLETHPNHDVAKAQMSGFGGIVSLELKGGLPSVELFVSKLKLFYLAESLGAIESLVCYPAQMSHASMTLQEKAQRGIGENLLRLSVGIENKDDLREDLERALA